MSDFDRILVGAIVLMLMLFAGMSAIVIHLYGL